MPWHAPSDAFVHGMTKEARDLFSEFDRDDKRRVNVSSRRLALISGLGCTEEAAQMAAQYSRDEARATRRIFDRFDVTGNGIAASAIGDALDVLGLPIDSAEAAEVIDSAGDPIELGAFRTLCGRLRKAQPPQRPQSAGPGGAAAQLPPQRQQSGDDGGQAEGGGFDGPAQPALSDLEIAHVRRHLLARAMSKRSTVKDVVHEQQVYFEGIERALHAREAEWALDMARSRDQAVERGVRASIWRPAKTPMPQPVVSTKRRVSQRPAKTLTMEEATEIANRVLRLQRSKGGSKGDAPAPVDGPRSELSSFVPTETRKHGRISQTGHTVKMGVPPPPGGHAPKYGSRDISFFCPPGAVQKGIRGTDSCCQPS